MYDDSSPSTTLPFRVIDVGIGEKKPRVYTTNGKGAGRYLTLSHCWGKVIPPRMTKKTLDSWQLLLPEADLPKTFRDAIWLTRELGELFLWIDSICIVQDDLSELRTQTGLMGSIFEQSLCTIAAVDAKGSDGSHLVDSGLIISGSDHILKTTSRGHVRAHRSSMRQRNYAKWSYTKRIIRVLPSGSDSKPRHGTLAVGYSKNESSPADASSSPNLTSVGGATGTGETEQTGIPERRNARGDYFLESSTAEGGVSYDAQCNLRKLWQMTVKQYSVTKLTYNSDKHNAIMGFEERLAARLGCRVHQGIIDFGQCEHLHLQLLWVPVISRGRLNDIQFPSWSWMKINGAVTWPHDEYLVFPELLAQIEFSQPTSKGAMQELHISGMFQSIRVGTRLGDIPYYKQHERWTPDMHFGWSELGMHPDRNTLLSAKEDRIIGWVVLDAPYNPGDMFALPLLKYLRQDDEEERRVLTSWSYVEAFLGLIRRL
ncbi:het-domain-containing protein [Fusarium phyllophilum]|uniref:Het-domain-containing protein n=1 Tax=Fusarium phyllophilum TaxID=47803 RepID=A0A8H5MKK8_9HYPO|nr:het-domain-containing protein [Fusarium phyllophilum]